MSVWMLILACELVMFTLGYILGLHVGHRNGWEERQRELVEHYRKVNRGNR